MLWRDFRTAADRATEQTRARGRLLVVQADGDVQMERGDFPLFPLTTIGRAPTNSVVIPDSFASSEHASLTLRGGQWWLEDQDSANGTALNRRPVAEPVVVSTGDVIHVGRVLLRVELD